MNVEKGTPLERLGYKSMESSGLTPLEYLVREQVLGSAAIWSGQQLRASGSKVTEARNFLIISLMTFYLFSIFLELLLNVSVGHPGPLAVLFSPFCVFDYSLEDRGWDGGWHHRVDAHESEQVPGVGDGQGSLVCWHAAVHGVAKSRTQLSDSTELNWEISSNLASTEFVIAAIDLNFLELFCELWMSECSLFKTSHSCVMDEKSFMWLMLSVCVCVCVCVWILAAKFELRNKRLIRCSESTIGTRWFPHYNEAICWGTLKVNFRGCFLSGWWDSLWGYFPSPGLRGRVRRTSGLGIEWEKKAGISSLNVQ